MNDVESSRAFSVRPERPEDADAVRRVVTQAFDRPDEAAIVDALRESGVVTLALVAEAEGQLVGHIAFSPVSIATEQGQVLVEEQQGVVGLAPVSVVPPYQGRGIGGRLIEEGLSRLRAAGHGAVVLLGHPNYYPRFGFRPAAERGLRWEIPCPPEAFMVQELRPGVLPEGGGVVRYRPELGGGD